MDSNKKIEELRQRGYDPVYTWNAEPNEEDPDHFHAFDVHIVIQQGEIEIKMDGKNMILKPGDEINIPRKYVHYGKAGVRGCRYIVAEKH